MPRPQKYDWEDKRDICFKLYVEQKLNADKIVEYFSKAFNLPKSELPSSKLFSNKFRDWGFPRLKERLSKEDEAAIVARTKELFSQNRRGTEIQKILSEEGWDVDDYHFRELRRKHDMLLRDAAPFGTTPKGEKRKRSSAYIGGANVEDETVPDAATQDSQLPSLTPEEAQRRAQRLADLQVQSDQRLQTRKRRRRIRGYGHLPPDAPGMAPRYGSETSLDECKAFLQLSNEKYVQLRDEFEAICSEMGIIKMTLCAQGEWQAAKDRHIRENMHLASVLHPLQPDIDQRLNAYNCLCQDVTKRMRSAGRTLSIADASNILGLGPHESKEIRRSLYEILEADHFTTVVAAGKEHMDELRQKWYATSDVLRRIIAENDPQKMKAIEVLNKDARKRFCDDRNKHDPSRGTYQTQKHYGPGPGPAIGKKSKKNDQGAMERPSRFATRNGKAILPVGPAWDGHEVPEWRTTTIADGPPINFDLDPLLSGPTLSAATHGPPWPPTSAGAPSSLRPGPSIPAYFRLAANSRIVGGHPKMWLGKLTSPTTKALHSAATSRAGAAKVAKVQGIAKNEDGTEDSWLIESDDELAVYLEEAGEKATFVVALDGGYA